MVDAVSVGDLRTALTEIRMNTASIDRACERLSEIQQHRHITGVAHRDRIDDCTPSENSWRTLGYGTIMGGRR